MSALTDRWNAFSDREKLLLGVAATLAALLLFSVLVLRPLSGLKANGVAAFEEAAVTRAAVARAVRSGGASPSSGGDLRGIASQTADAAGIVIDRYDFRGDAVDLTISEVAAPDLYGWLGTLSSEHGVVVDEASLRADEDGLLTARMTLSFRR